MADDPINLKDLKNRRHIEAARKLDAAVWGGLVGIWQEYQTGARVLPPHASGLTRNAEPEGVFAKLTEDLVALAQAAQVSDMDITGTLLLLILTTAPPLDGTRLHELITRASDLIETGDEESSIKMDRIDKATAGMTDAERLVWYKEHKDDPEYKL
jgi:hypothetical protein